MVSQAFITPRFSPFATQTIPATVHEAPYILDVGLAVEVALERGGTAEVSIDGQSQQVRIEAGEPAALEAKRELRLDLPGIGVVHVRGGGRDLLREAAAAEERWDGAAKPVLARAGCTTLPALEALRARADALLETVSGLERQAEQEQARAENLDELERRAVVAKADVELRRAALADLLDDGESVAEHVNGLDEQPRDETSIEQTIARLEARVREREELRQQLERAVAAEEREVASRRRDLAEKQAEQRKAQEAGDDWRQVLAGARAEGDRLRREIEGSMPSWRRSGSKRPPKSSRRRGHSPTSTGKSIGRGRRCGRRPSAGPQPETNSPGSKARRRSFVPRPGTRTSKPSGACAIGVAPTWTRYRPRPARSIRNGWPARRPPRPPQPPTLGSWRCGFTPRRARSSRSAGSTSRNGPDRRGKPSPPWRNANASWTWITAPGGSCRKRSPKRNRKRPCTSARPWYDRSANAWRR